MRLRKILILAGVLGAAVLLTGIVLTAGYLALLVPGISSPRPLHYRAINVDTHTMTAELSDPFPGRYPPRAQYYSTFRSNRGLGIYHYDGAKDLPFKVRYNAFDADHDKRLLGRSKLQELSHGPYGTVYAKTGYTYGTTSGSCLEVMLYGNKAEHEPAQIVGGLPRPTPQLGAISLVRVLRTHPEYAVVTAVYDPHGELQRAHIYGSSSGDWHWNQETAMEIAEEDDALRSRLPAGRLKYGLPDRFPIVDYLERHQWEWKDVGKPNPENIINLHYDYNRWVRQDVFDVAGKCTTRYLTYVVTREDKMLEEIDRKVPFDQFKSK